MYKIVEKKRPMNIHAMCDTLQGAERWLNVLAPEYCAKGYFMDKLLTPESFMIASTNAKESALLKSLINNQKKL